MSEKVAFRIQLLSGKNVVLVEAPGYESEIFMPHIVNGRIAFLNVIPNRRCCSGKLSNKLAMAIKAEHLTPQSRTLLKSSRIQAGSENENIPVIISPLAMSTPTNPIKIKGGVNMTTMDSENTLPTPDIARKDPGKRQDVAMNISTFNLPRGLKVMRLFSNSTEGPQSNTKSVASSTKESEQISNTDSLNVTGVHDLSSNFRINSIPLIHNTYRDDVVSSTHKQKGEISKNIKASSRKWRKVRTPKRTYSRRGDHEIPQHDKSLDSTVRNIKPSFLANPTMAPKTAYTVELKKRQLTLDNRIRIPSKIIKKNQLNSIKHSGSEHLQKSIKHIGSNALSAFDLLTNSNKAARMSQKLNEQFRKGCLNKASSTYQKYKALSTVPRLKEDEQVLEMTGKPKQTRKHSDAHKENLPLTKKTSKPAALKIADNASAGSTGNVLAKPSVQSSKASSPKRSIKTKKSNA